MADTLENFLSITNRLHNLNVFSLLPLGRHDYMVLFTIRCLQRKYSGCLTVSAVAKEMHVVQPAVSRTLRSLEELGLIQREVSREDRRNTYVALTPEGTTAIQEAEHVLEQFHQGVQERFTPEEMHLLILLMERLYAVSKEQIEKMKKGATKNE
ncbi:MAG: MarR family winged helix-turn-helix transcriptional regulator [Ruminococcus sp.]